MDDDEITAIRSAYRWHRRIGTMTRLPKQPAPTPKEPSHALVGAGLHCKDKSGKVQNQATVVAVIPSGNPTVGDLALVQYFEWGVGEPSTRRLVPLSEFAKSDRWVFYSSVDEMKDHYERVDKYRDRHVDAASALPPSKKPQSQRGRRPNGTGRRSNTP